MNTGKIKINFDIIYNSNSCGPFKIIQDLGKDERSKQWVRIKFINTRYEKDVRYDIAMEGKVRDELFGIDFNKEYQSNYYGPFRIIEYKGRGKDSDKIVKIKFCNTGYEYDVSFDAVLTGLVKDHSVNYEDRKYISQEHSEYDKRLRQIIKNRWRSMMSRCYNENSVGYAKYGALGVTVCEYWHNFDNFIRSLPSLINYDKFYRNPSAYQLDKDYLQQGVPMNCKIYSPTTCVFLNIYDNANLSIKDSHQGEYYGIKTTPAGNYLIEFSINGRKHIFGTYSNLVAALNEYNYYYLLFGRFELVPLLNQVQFMSHCECQKYLIRSNIEIKFNDYPL